MSNKAEPFMNPSVGQYKEAMDNTFLPEKEKHTDRERTRLRNILKNFCDTTSMHGCSKISGSTLAGVKISWGILTAGAVAILMFHLYSIFDTYYKWPIQTKVSLGFDNLRYPAITLCNVNMVKKSALNSDRSPEMRRFRRLVNSMDPDSLLESMTQKSGAGVQSFGDDGNTTDANSTTVTNSTAKTFSDLYSDIDLTSYDEDLFEAEVNETTEEDWGTQQDPRYLIEEVFRNSYLNINRRTRLRVGHDIEEMLISCLFSGHTCYADNFTLYQTSSFGNCWTLSSHKLVAKSTGPQTGLSLILFLQTNEFLEGLTSGYGIKLVIHYPGTKPLPDDEGLFISAATETNIGLVQKTIIRLGGNYGDCEDGVNFKNKVGFQYSRQACQAVCEISRGLDECGCYGTYNEELAIAVDKTATICNTTEEKRCINRVQWNLEQKNTVCNCLNPCSEVVYDQSVSSRQWPTESYANLLLEGVCEKDPDNCQNLRLRGKDSRHVANNFVKLNIYFESLNYERIEEEPLIDVFQFLASIGGALGLWIGLSMLSFCEIMQLCGKIIEYLIERCRHVAHYDNSVKT